MKIYTKTGDTGKTGLFGGERRLKDDIRITAYGEVDELQSVLGIAMSYLKDPVFKDMVTILEHIQRKGFVLAGQLAGAYPNKESQGIEADDVEWLQSCIDTLDATLPLLRKFILPGGSQAAAHLHHARTVCRRAERAVVTLHRTEEVSLEILKYLNRLSDLLFVLARSANHRLGIPDQIWEDKAELNQSGKVV